MTEINSVFPTSNRVFYTFMYKLEKIDAQGSYIVIESSVGKDEIPEEIRNESVNVKGKVLGNSHIVASKLVPIKNQAGEIEATEVIYVNHVDLGGSLPGWMVKKFGLSSIVLQAANMIADVKKVASGELTL
jgi:hypothetical protein